MQLISNDFSHYEIVWQAKKKSSKYAKKKLTQPKSRTEVQNKAHSSPNSGEIN